MCRVAAVAKAKTVLIPNVHREWA
eukprot:COSAG02_NODE_60056_length_272_cov_0.884393_1_plen_23_part_01